MFSLTFFGLLKIELINDSFMSSVNYHSSRNVILVRQKNLKYYSDVFENIYLLLSNCKYIVWVKNMKNIDSWNRYINIKNTPGK